MTWPRRWAFWPVLVHSDLVLQEMNASGCSMSSLSGSCLRRAASPARYLAYTHHRKNPKMLLSSGVFDCIAISCSIHNTVWTGNGAASRRSSFRS